jgi:hypothetical protein
MARETRVFAASVIPETAVPAMLDEREVVEVLAMSVDILGMK